MELWIKSQDKECLMKVDRLDYDLSNNEHRIMVNGYKTLVAKYETKERALEILDEIQELLQPIYKVTSEFKKSEITGNCQWTENQEYIPIQTKVYEMPRE